MDHPPLVKEDFTVGWVCALDVEVAAAQAMLDREYEDSISLQPGDSNTYTLGSIGVHKVVIASLPAGNYGETSAAVVATSMLGSFPNIRFGLMVGVGGGIPSKKNDIRLGDIVVSQPQETNGGVVQFDLGKATDSGFVKTGSLNRPPTVLLTALNKLKSKHILGVVKFTEHITEMYKNFPRTRKNFKHLGADNDSLFKASYGHISHVEDTCEECDTSCMVQREDRHTEDPDVHYGTIASGNQVIKHAQTRDELGLKHKALCFEMEAAGLMNNFPCIVIRGICDYSDSHKNKQWQPFAALSAAAYAKELLSFVSLTQVEETRKASQILTSIQQGIDRVCEKIDEWNLDADQEKAINWLSSPDPSTNQNVALKKRHHGTGLWFVQGKKFADWKSGAKPFLWLHGMPGCGKTVLSSAIIDDLSKDHLQVLLYFFFDFSVPEKQSLDNMLRSLITQLYRQRKETRFHLDKLWRSFGEGSKQPTVESLEKAFRGMIDDTKDVKLVLDALDESQTRDDLLEWLQAVFQSTNVRLIVTSRREGDIEAAFTAVAQPEDVVPIQRSDVNKDIGAYVCHKVRNDPKLKRWRSFPDVQKEIESALMQKADGMFRWIECQFVELGRCLDLAMLHDALSNLLESLDDTYASMLGSIPKIHKRQATMILRFLAWSDRPLRLEEMVDAIAVRVDEEPCFKPMNRLPEPTEILQFCPSLVELRASTKYQHDGISGQPAGGKELHLAHFSVKEYLMTKRDDKVTEISLDESVAKASLATICLKYLSHVNRFPSTKVTRTRFVFSEYCARYWASFARVGETMDPDLQRFISSTLQDRRWKFVTLWHYFDEDKQILDQVESFRLPQPNALCYAAMKGLVTTTTSLLKSVTGFDTLGRSNLLDAALWVATIQNQVAIVQILLLEGANPNSINALKSSPPLQAASAAGYEKVVQTLLNGGADVNGVGSQYGVALHAASAKGQLGVVKLLLENGANVNLRGTGDHFLYETALAAAIFEKHSDVALILLDHGADYNTQCGSWDNAESGSWDNAVSGSWDNAIQAAAFHGLDKVVKKLLDIGGNVNFGDGGALQAASCSGNSQMVNLLLRSGAPVNAQGPRFGSPLRAASLSGHDDIVRLLLQNGADVNASGGLYGNALDAAISEHNETIVRTLLEHGFDVKLDNVIKALRLYSRSSITMLLPHLTVEMMGQTEDHSSMNVLHWAAKTGSKEAVERCLELNADVHSRAERNMTALHHAVIEGHFEITKLLCENGCGVETVDDERLAPLDYASEKLPYYWTRSKARKEDIEIMEYLNSNTRESHKIDALGRTPLHRAAEEGDEDNVRRWLELSSNVHTKDRFGRTPLHLAGKNNHLSIVKILVEAGSEPRVVAWSSNEMGKDVAEYLAQFEDYASVPRSLSASLVMSTD